MLKMWNYSKIKLPSLNDLTSFYSISELLGAPKRVNVNIQDPDG